MKDVIIYKSNKNVVYSCKYHVVWCPKYRRKVLIDGIDERLKDILLGQGAGILAYSICEMKATILIKYCKDIIKKFLVISFFMYKLNLISTYYKYER